MSCSPATPPVYRPVRGRMTFSGTPVAPETARETPFSAWASQDSNLGPTDYEAVYRAGDCPGRFLTGSGFAARLCVPLQRWKCSELSVGARALATSVAPGEGK